MSTSRERLMTSAASAIACVAVASNSARLSFMSGCEMVTTLPAIPTISELSEFERWAVLGPATVGATAMRSPTRQPAAWTSWRSSNDVAPAYLRTGLL